MSGAIDERPMDERPIPYNPMAKYIKQGRDFNPPVADMMLERRYFANKNTRFAIEMIIIPKNKYSSAKGTVQIYKINDDTSLLHLYTTQSYDFRFIQSRAENTFRFVFHTLPHGESYTYLIQYHVVFDNNAEALYSFNDQIEKVSASHMLMDQVKITSSTKDPISIGSLDIISVTDINILASNLRFTIDGISSNENVIHDVANLSASEQLDWAFYPIYIKRITIGGFPQTQLQNWNKDMFSHMVLQVIYRDKLMFVAPLEQLDENNKKINYFFSDEEAAKINPTYAETSTHEYGLNTGIDFLFLNSGWRVASPERLWFLIILVLSLVLYMAYSYFDLDILFIIIPIPLIVFYTTQLSTYGLDDIDPEIYKSMKRQWLYILLGLIVVVSLYILWWRNSS
jgi:hypothetical protein